MAYYLYKNFQIFYLSFTYHHLISFHESSTKILIEPLNPQLLSIHNFLVCLQTPITAHYAALNLSLVNSQLEGLHPSSPS